MLKVHSNADCKFLSDDRGFLPSNKTAAVVDFGHCGKTTRDRKKVFCLEKKVNPLHFLLALRRRVKMTGADLIIKSAPVKVTTTTADCYSPC